MHRYQTGERKGSGSSQAEERTMIDEDWWLVNVLIPEEGLTSPITISPSNTQSHQPMAPKWQRCSPASGGKLRPLSGKGMCFGSTLGLFILVWRERASEWRHFCFSGRFREGFSSDFFCVDTMKCGAGSQRRGAVVSAALVSSQRPLADDYHRHVCCTKSMFCVRVLRFENSGDTRFQRRLFSKRLKWFKPPRVWESLAVRPLRVSKLFIIGS